MKLKLSYRSTELGTQKAMIKWHANILNTKFNHRFEEFLKHLLQVEIDIMLFTGRFVHVIVNACACAIASDNINFFFAKFVLKSFE